MQDQAETADERWQILNYKIVEFRLGEIFKFLRGQGIEPILIKGWAASRNYPQPWKRSFVDFDIVVSPDEYEKVSTLPQTDGAHIDYHCGLRHLDSVEWEDLYAASVTIEVNGTPIRVLCAEDHLRVLCVHWLNDGGANRQRLEDIFYAVANRPDDFDWQRCTGIVAENRRRWIAYAIGLAHRYLNLKIDDLPFAESARRVPEWMIETVEAEWRSGIPLLPLDACLHDKKMLFRQILKRLPPNGIEATIEMNGDLDARTRIVYQLRSAYARVKPSLKRFKNKFFKR